jgi:catechol 2,3-dioxygenase-like lactoylglutathione lyase family enzyme
VISRIHSTTIIVADQDKALDFYVNTLGWNKDIDQQMGPDMRYVTVVPPGAETQLALGLASWFGPNDSVRSGGNTGIAFVSPDIEETYATLKSRGVRFKGELEQMPWGAKATWFYDLDGNEFFLSGEQGT